MAIQGFNSDANQWVSMRVAINYDVTLDKVMYVGRCDNSHLWRAICFYCTERRNTAPAYWDGIAKPSSFADFVVNLKPGLDVVDNTTRKRYLVMVGQCEDCGSVYYSDFEKGQEVR